MIKIIKGTYGVKRLTSKSDPFTLSDEEEKRLVALGVAEYVTVPETPAQGEGENKPAETPAQGEGENKPAETPAQGEGEGKAPAKAEKKAAGKNTGKAKAAKK